MTENSKGAVPGTAEQQEVARHAQQAAGDLVTTGREQAKMVVGETADQVKSAVQDMRTRVADQAENQARRVAQQLTRIADELGGMAENQSSDSMTAPLIRQVADTSRQAADFLDNRGAHGLLDSVQDYARRKPGTFLLGAAVAGFLVGRVAKTASGGSDGAGRQSSTPEVTAPAPRSGDQPMRPTPTPVGAGRGFEAGGTGEAGTGYPGGQSGAGHPGQTGHAGYSGQQGYTGQPGYSGQPGHAGPAGMGYPGQSGVDDPVSGRPGPSGMGYPGQSGVDRTGGGPHVDR
uniref:hypothetical protein n=1 Tax=Saccharothrix mutabilis TaxID=33921 RepID=UPI0031D6BD66